MIFRRAQQQCRGDNAHRGHPQPPDRVAVIGERFRRRGHQLPGQLTKQQSHRKLNPPNDRPGEHFRNPIQQTRRPKHHKDAAPISSAPAAISSAPKPCAIAIAPNAFNGCTGTGSRYTSPATTYSSPAGNRTADGVSPFFTINATAIGTSTPKSASAPANSAKSNRNEPPADSSCDGAVLTMRSL